ncbi:MAG: NADH-quinone oxidoreductase subunit N [Planctomycetes bacterium]|nr:NADH-quinone oxidoreductase subunit N [Planctomycetota bacterium]
MPQGFAELLSRNAADLGLILPEVMVALAFIFGLVVELALPAKDAENAERRKTGTYVLLIGLLLALWINVNDMKAYVGSLDQAVTIYSTGRDGATVTVTRNTDMTSQDFIYSKMVVRDSFGTFVKFVLLLGTIVTVLVALNAKELESNGRGEFILLLAATCLGGMFLASSTNLLMLYLSLESLSIVSYAMAGFLRGDRKSSEAGLKYVMYGAMASGIMIFGISYLYGLTGTLNLDEVAAHFRGMEAGHAPHTRGALAAVLAMVFAGLLYKIAAVPFHYWAPDVYEGAPTTATGFFSVVPKAAGFAVLVRVIAAFFPIGDIDDQGFNFVTAEKVLTVVAILTMTIGNLAALGQSNAKRMLAYSSIAHAGYMLAGLAALSNANGAAAVLFYLVVYLLMNLGAFLVLVALENVRGSCDLDKLRGTIRREPLLGTALVIFLFSLTGMPPLAGFIGKYLIMLELASAGNWLLVVVMGLNSVISLYYYMRLAKAVAIDAPGETPVSGESNPPVLGVLAVGKVAMLLALFVWFEPVQKLCQQVMVPLLPSVDERFVAKPDAGSAVQDEARLTPAPSPEHLAATPEPER